MLHDPKGNFRVYVKPIEKQGAGENVQHAKKVAFTGDEAWRTLVHFDELFPLVYDESNSNQEAKMKQMQEVIVECQGYFEELYKEVTLPHQMQAKATELRKIGKVMITLFAKCVAKEKITPYLHATVCAIPDQCALFDVLKLSGQGLENLNQYRKRYGKINRKITKHSSPVMQLSKQECSRVALGLTGKIKPSTCTVARMKRRCNASSTPSTCPISIKRQKARVLRSVVL